jgi:hypothetical protein
VTAITAFRKINQTVPGGTRWGGWMVTEAGNGKPAKKSAKLTYQFCPITIVLSDADLYSSQQLAC